LERKEGWKTVEARASKTKKGKEAKMDSGYLPQSETQNVDGAFSK
jgi:hypothetical protein